jgi:hypothetical protein
MEISNLYVSLAMPGSFSSAIGATVYSLQHLNQMATEQSTVHGFTSDVCVVFSLLSAYSVDY